MHAKKNLIELNRGKITKTFYTKAGTGLNSAMVTEFVYQMVTSHSVSSIKQVPKYFQTCQY